MVNGLHLYSAFIQSAVQFMPLIHTFTHTPCWNGLQFPALLWKTVRLESPAGNCSPGTLHPLHKWTGHRAGMNYSSQHYSERLWGQRILLCADDLSLVESENRISLLPLFIEWIITIQTCLKMYFQKLINTIVFFLSHFLENEILHPRIYHRAYMSIKCLSSFRSPPFTLFTPCSSFDIINVSHFDSPPLKECTSNHGS